MIDFHCHLLPSLDDGAITVDDSIAMAKALSAFGYKAVCCTPHCIKGYYDLTPQKVREATLMLQADLDNADIELELWPGMEYMLDECFAEYAEDLLPLGDTKLVLCEAPQQAHPGFVQEGLELIVEKGFVPLIAHPERTQYFFDILSERGTRDEVKDRDAERGTSDAENLKGSKSFLKRIWPFASRVPRSASQDSKSITTHELKNSDSGIPKETLFHANLGSFTGYYGQQTQRKAYELLKLDVYSALASDLHDGGSVSKVLVHDKFAMNPFLKKLAEFDGSAAALFKAKGGNGVEGGQGELF
jgi:protein-tyrosine phosphatase